MKTTIKNLLSLSLLIFILVSCGKKAAEVLVPEDAAMVIHINTASLSSKLSWDEIKNSDWFKMINKEGASSDLERKLLENPENSGIDLKGDMYVFVQMRGNNSYVVVQGKIKDVKAYETMIDTANDKKEIKKEGGFSYTGDENGCVTWTNDRFIIVGNASGMQPRRSPFGNSVKTKITIDSIVKYAKDLYSLKNNNSISNDSRYASLTKEQGDVHFWVNSSALLKNSMPMGLDLLKAASLLEGNVSGYTLNFDNGKITANTKTWYNKELGALMKKYKPGNLNTDMLKKIQGQDVSVVFAMNYPPEGIKEFLKLFGIDGMVNGFIGDFGLTIDDFVKANKGDLLFAVSDISVQDKEMSLPGVDNHDFSNPMPHPAAKILFATSINDKPSFDKLINVLKTEISKQPGADEALGMIKYTVKDNWFIAGNAQEAIDGFASGSTTDHPFISKISGHPMGGFIDLQKISSGIRTNKLGPAESIFSGEGKVWENIIFYGGEMKDGATTAYVEVNMFDKNTNSLKQLNNFFNTIAAKFKGDHDMSDQPFPGVDSLTAPKPRVN